MKTVWDVCRRITVLQQEIVTLVLTDGDDKLLEKKKEELAYCTSERNRMFAEMDVCKVCGEKRG